MMLIAGIMSIVVGFSILCSKDTKYCRYVLEGASGGVFIIAGAILCICYLFKDIPQPIDVYRNKTTLKITYKDSIPVDSIVVFK